MKLYICYNHIATSVHFIRLIVVVSVDVAKQKLVKAADTFGR